MNSASNSILVTAFYVIVYAQANCVRLLIFSCLSIVNSLPQFDWGRKVVQQTYLFAYKYRCLECQISSHIVELVKMVKMIEMYTWFCWWGINKCHRFALAIQFLCVRFADVTGNVWALTVSITTINSNFCKITSGKWSFVSQL